MLLIHEIKPVLTLNKPIYAGFTVLELSKWLMYDCHYNFVKKHFDTELLFTDTDSLTYSSQKTFMQNFLNTNIYLTLEIFQRTLSFMMVKMVVGKMKVEHKGILIKKFVGLKSRIHSMLSDDHVKEFNTAKRINTGTELNEFKDTSFDKKVIRHKMKRIQGKKHKIGTYEINKTSLSCFDDKRFVLEDGIHTLAYFHKDLKK